MSKAIFVTGRLKFCPGSGFLYFDFYEVGIVM
jgi:hypothetical protein